MALAHDNREPGIVGWIEHEFGVHTTNALFFSALISYFAIRFLYTKFLEPDHVKQAKRRRKNRNNGSSHNDVDDSSGCSGCGGCD